LREIVSITFLSAHVLLEDVGIEDDLYLF
jgi:hypothetical protein